MKETLLDCFSSSYLFFYFYTKVSTRIITLPRTLTIHLAGLILEVSIEFQVG